MVHFKAGELTLRDSPDGDCYEGIVGGEVVGLVVYKRIGGRVIVRHTAIDPQYRGHGYGSALVRAVLDDLRTRGDRLTNFCGFVADFIEDHPDYADLVDTAHAGVTLPRDKRGMAGPAPARYQ